MFQRSLASSSGGLVLTVELSNTSNGYKHLSNHIFQNCSLHTHNF